MSGDCEHGPYGGSRRPLPRPGWSPGGARPCDVAVISRETSGTTVVTEEVVRPAYAPPWREAVGATVPPWLAARAAVAAAYVLARVAVDQLAVAQPAPLVDGLMSWDADHYRTIAEQGYDAFPHAYRFFPLFPMLVRALSTLTFGNATVAALVIANGAALLLGMAVYRLVVTETGDAAVGRLTTWLLLAGPAAAPLVLGYAETLGAAASVFSLLAARQGRWWRAAVAAAVVGSTWSIGWVLAVPLAIEAVSGLRRAGRRSVLARGVAVAAPVVAGALFVGWVEVATGDGWANVVTVQTEVYDRTLVDPVTALYRAAEDLLVGHHASGVPFPWAVLAIGLTAAAFRLLPRTYGAYTAVLILVAISSTNIDSFERYVLRAFPLVITGAMLLKVEWQQRLATTIGLAGLVVYATAMFLGAKVP